jgi:hypothetical protein
MPKFYVRREASRFFIERISMEKRFVAIAILINTGLQPGVLVATW